MKCSACGKFGIKLKKCTECYSSVRYCNVQCQKSHRKAHKKECRKIAAEKASFDAAVMELPLSNDEVVHPPPQPECPLCMYTLPPNISRQSKYMPCCAQVICKACYSSGMDIFPSSGDQFGSSLLANFLPGNFEKQLEKIKCPFCRSADTVPIKDGQKRHDKRLEERAEGGDATAMLELGKAYYSGRPEFNYEKGKFDDNVGQDTAKALECIKKAADLGNGHAFFWLSELHRKNHEAEEYLVCLQKAAQLGSFEAHVEIADIALKRDNKKKAMEHYKVLAAAGSIQYSQNAIDHLKAGYTEGLVTKDEYASSLRAYQSAREDIMSPDRLRWARFGVTTDGQLSPDFL